MRLQLPISLSLLLLSWQNAGAQLAPADDFFHSGAQFYISNNIPQAKQAVEMGRKLYPNDDKLKRLEELLKQQQQQSQQNQQSKDQQQSQQQKADSQKESKDDQQKQNEQKPADQKQADEEKKAEQQKAAADKKAGEKPDDQKGEGQPVAAGQMTPEEAKRLLDAQKGNEQFLQLKPTDKPRDNRRPVKDW